ncbi:class B sortase [Oceanobacillus sp. CAU 1775]
MSNKAKRILSTVITVICLGVFIYAGYGLVTTILDYSKNDRLVSDLQDTFYNSVADEPTTDANGKKNIRSGFDALLNENDELVGWLTIEGTAIDYPIVQTDNNHDYLQRDFYKNDNILGSIFMDFRNDIEDTDDRNTIIYGHRTKNGTMFEGLTKYLDQAFLDEHPTFTFDTLYDSYEAEVFAVYNTLTDFNYIQTDFANTEDYDSLLSNIKSHSLVETDVEVGPDDRIITLSTCDYALDDNDGRLVVQAKLVKKGQSKQNDLANAEN